MTRLIPQVLVDNPTALNLLLWSGPVVWCVIFIVALRSQWNISHPLAKWGILSVLAHNILFVYATTIMVVQGSGRSPSPPPTVEVSIVDADEGLPPDSETRQVRPWQDFASATPELAAQQPVERRPRESQTPIERQAVDAVAPLPPEAAPHDLLTDQPLDPQREALAQAAPAHRQTSSSGAKTIETIGPQRRDHTATVQPQPPEPRRLVARREPGISRYLSSDETAAQLPPRRAGGQQLDELPTERPIAEALAASDELLAKGSRSPSQVPSESLPREAGTTGLVKSTARRGDAGQDIGQPTLVPTAAPKIASSRRAGDKGPLPGAYRLRTAPDRPQVVKSRGGDAETEAAVRAALDWLAKVQSRDGRWDPRVHGAGWEPRIDGQDRQGAGARADTAITGLAVLAYLGAGHTHLEGDYRDNVRRGIEYLLRSQNADDGNLGGRASTFAFMYSHAMATFALCEAYAVTGDERLEKAVRQAVNYTLRAQDPRAGGWRYKPGDAGDTSQLGWQVMVISSAELAGIVIPQQTKTGVRRFLQSVSAGEHGGLARYQPHKAISRAMTAEALFCRQLIDCEGSRAATKEAVDFLLADPPGDGKANLYYWYYATLAMNQVGGDAWTRWNTSLKRALLPKQRRDGALAGSWDANTVWGAHGGRVYSTALAALSLEVYYRYSPLRPGAVRQRSP